MLDRPGRDLAAPRALLQRLWEARAAFMARTSKTLAAGARRWWKWAVAAAFVAMLLRFVIWPAVFGPLVPADLVGRAEFVQSVVASGHVEAPFRVSVGSQITGVVTDVSVTEGETVKAGQTLVVLDDREAKAAVVLAEGAVAQAEARMRQMKEFTLPTAEETLLQAQATLRNAEHAYERTSKLAGDGVATKAALDDVTRARDIARAQVRSAELQVFTNRPGGSDYVIAESLLNQSRASLAAAQSRLSYTIIGAPRDGVLIARNVERGNVVQPSAVLKIL